MPDFKKSFFLTSFLLLLGFSYPVMPYGAPGYPGVDASWSSAKKTNIGTFFNSQRSLVWFTSANGILTEIFFPTIDNPQIRDSQLLISDGKTFFSEEKKNTAHQVDVLSPSITKLTNYDPQNRFHISHTYFTLEDSSTVVDEVELSVFEDNLSAYLLINPALNNTGFGDEGNFSQGQLHFWEKNDDKSNTVSLTVETSVPIEKASLGYVGISDGYQDLLDNFRMDNHYHSIAKGNIAGMAKLAIPPKKGIYKFYISYKFNKNKKISNQINFDKAKKHYQHTWNKYLFSLKKPGALSPQETELYLRSIYLLKVMEDKLNPGAMVASLSKPWGDTSYEKFSPFPNRYKSGGYHLIWPRDLFHVSLALLFSGDTQTPLRALRFLKRIQYKSGTWLFGNKLVQKKGALPQNTWTSGKVYWSGLQLDQVGYAIHLFHHLYTSNEYDKKNLLKEFKPFLTRALEFIATYGPWTAQERWEENFGISPSSTAVATAALLIGDKYIPKKNYKKKANDWLYNPNGNIHKWTFTENGVYGDGNYYVRISGCNSHNSQWDPNQEQVQCYVANTGGRKVTISQFLDQGFLKLSLLGLVPADDYRILTSLQKINTYIKQDVQTKTGTFPAWYRYTHDSYGKDGGRLWPLLSGEHGRFQLELYKTGQISWNQAQTYVNTILDSFHAFANDGLMIPEQVYENGKGTGSATPLAWSHAEFIKLLWSRELQKNIENPFHKE